MKAFSEVGGVCVEFIRMVTDTTPSSDEGVGGFNKDRGVELAMVNVDIDVQEGEVFQVKWTG